MRAASANSVYTLPLVASSVASFYLLCATVKMSYTCETLSASIIHYDDNS